MIYKLTVDTDGHEAPVDWGDTFCLQGTTGPGRILIGARNPVALLRKMIPLLGPEFHLLYVLGIPRGEGEPGRYQSPAMTLEAVDAFLVDFKEFLEKDARHHLWIRSTQEQGLLVFEKHNLIYGYGPLEEIQGQLRASGFKYGKINMPSPHIHYYHDSFDGEARRILQVMEWNRTELREGDDA